MGFFSRLGNKLADGMIKGARLGKKALGSAARLGNKIADTGTKIVRGVESVPILGRDLAPVTSVARTGIGLVKDISAGASAGARMLDTAEGIVRGGREAIRTGDIQQAQQVLRNTKALGQEAKSNLQRARSVMADIKR
jgi:hypothetical protein